MRNKLTNRQTHKLTNSQTDGKCGLQSCIVQLKNGQNQQNRNFPKKRVWDHLYNLMVSNEPILSNIQESRFSGKYYWKWHQTRILLNKELGSTYTLLWSLTWCKISKKSNNLIIKYWEIYKSIFFSQKWPKMAKICKKRIFLKKGFRVNLYPLLGSNFMQNMKKI